MGERGARILLAATVFALAFTFRNVARIIALRGALLGSVLVYCLPPLIFLHSQRGRAASRTTRGLHGALIAYGGAMAVFGTLAVLRS